MSNTLTGRVAIITGTSRGIGAAIAKRLAAEGARVAITARTQAPGGGKFSGSLQQTEEAIRALGGECLTIAADLTQAADRSRIVAETIARYGGVDILINNAAFAQLQATKDQSDEIARRQFETNLFAPLHLSQLCVPSMTARGGGWIVNLSSASSNHPAPAPYDSADQYFQFHVHSSPTLYGASKAALERMTTGMAAELAQFNIAVNAVAPVQAVATEAALAAGINESVAHMEPEEAMAEAALQLCSRPAQGLSGRVLLSLDLLRELGAMVHTLDGRGALANFVL